MFIITGGGLQERTNWVNASPLLCESSFVSGLPVSHLNQIFLFTRHTITTITMSCRSPLVLFVASLLSLCFVSHHPNLSQSFQIAAGNDRGYEEQQQRNHGQQLSSYSRVRCRRNNALHNGITPISSCAPTIVLPFTWRIAEQSIEGLCQLGVCE